MIAKRFNEDLLKKLEEAGTVPQDKATHAITGFITGEFRDRLKAMNEADKTGKPYLMMWGRPVPMDMIFPLIHPLTNLTCRR